MVSCCCGYFILFCSSLYDQYSEISAIDLQMHVTFVSIPVVDNKLIIICSLLHHNHVYGTNVRPCPSHAQFDLCSAYNISYRPFIP